MNFTARCFLTSKPGEDITDCEDSIFPPPTSSTFEHHRSLAVSDGTTTSFFSGLWSRTLTKHFASNPEAVFELSWEQWLQPAQKEWQSEVGQLAQSNRVSLFTRNGVRSRRPAAATFAAILLDPVLPNGTIPWRAITLGDSCLFFLRQDGRRSIPLTRAEQFSNWVAAADSYETPQAHLPTRHLSTPRGEEAPLQEGDVIMLATDALSRWLLLREELGHPVWGTLLSLESAVQFEALVADARAETFSPLEPDDVALAILTTGTAHEYIHKGTFKPRSLASEPKAPSPTISSEKLSSENTGSHFEPLHLTPLDGAAHPCQQAPGSLPAQ
jgi:hypothetical protein